MDGIAMTTHLTDGRPLTSCDRALCGFHPITHCLTEDPKDVTCRDCLELMREREQRAGRSCWACRHSFMEPDDDLTCGHKDAGPVGTYVTVASSAAGHCGQHRTKFEQHPLRNPDGTLRMPEERKS